MKRAIGVVRGRCIGGQRGGGRPSFRFPEGSQMELQKLNRRKTQVKLPKLGWVKFRASRSLDGETIRSATLSKEGERWLCRFW